MTTDTTTRRHRATVALGLMGVAALAARHLLRPDPPPGRAPVDAVAAPLGERGAADDAVAVDEWTSAAAVRRAPSAQAVAFDRVMDRVTGLIEAASATRATPALSVAAPLAAAVAATTPAAVTAPVDQSRVYATT